MFFSLFINLYKDISEKVAILNYINTIDYRLGKLLKIDFLTSSIYNNQVSFT